jgi:hypothetical protein
MKPLVLPLLLALCSTPILAGGHRVFCTLDSNPDFLVCRDKTGVYFKTDHGYEALARVQSSASPVYTNAEQSFFIEVEVSGSRTFLIHPDGTRQELSCSKPELERCPS